MRNVSLATTWTRIEVFNLILFQLTFILFQITSLCNNIYIISNDYFNGFSNKPGTFPLAWAKKVKKHVICFVFFHIIRVI